MSDIVKVYVAASSKEIERATRWMDKLRDLAPYGIEVISTWPEDIACKQGGVPNPSNALRADRAAWADRNLDQIEESDVFWMLAPDHTIPENHGHGAYAELSAAIILGVVTRLVSGETTQSVFNALCEEYPSDEAAFASILVRARG